MDLQVSKTRLIFAVVLLLLIAACSSKPPAPSSSAKRYELKGKIVSTDRPNKKMTINHQEIPGYMDAMTMPFTVIDDWAFDAAAPGADIQATLIVDTGRTWLENPVIVNTGPASGNEAVVEPKPGDETPDFIMTNQDGKKVTFLSYRGRTVLLTFIYTRCPLPDYCPLMSKNFAEVNRELQKNPALAARTQLLSISVDPAHDKPEVLKKYAVKYAGGTPLKNWEYATGTPEEIKVVAQFFGLNYWPEKDQIIHSLRTAIVGPDGRLVKVYRGNEWKPAEVLADLAKVSPPVN